ncbi:MAG: methylated-DNA-[protein]-cysteine S-methyltransferase [Candidatus Thermoplasmatota archaeon]|nr:methylated-DNA-[protein]-cysteine S-methyltransferase [Candidatus Thermoplasmatota archaeon]
MPFRTDWAEHFRAALTDIEITRGGITGSVGSEVQGPDGEAEGMRKEDVRTEKDIREYLEGWSDFEKAVYIATFRIPKGKVSTYGRIAEAIGRPRASRAVANTLHENPLWPVVPCHRVVCSDGRFGGPTKWARGRRKHVVEEGTPVVDGKVVLNEDTLF